MIVYYTYCFAPNNIAQRSFHMVHLGLLHFLTAAQYSTVTMYHNLFNYSPTDRHSSYFQPFTITNKAALTSLYKHLFMNVLVYLWDKLLEVELFQRNLHFDITKYQFILMYFSLTHPSQQLPLFGFANLKGENSISIQFTFHFLISLNIYIKLLRKNHLFFLFCGMSGSCLFLYWIFKGSLYI